MTEEQERIIAEWLEQRLLLHLAETSSIHIEDDGELVLISVRFSLLRETAADALEVEL